MKLLLATDGSDTARAAVDFLTAFPFPEPREIVVISVVEPVLGSDEVEGLTPDRREAFEQTHRAEMEQAERISKTECERLSGHGWVGSTMVRIGEPAEEIALAVGELGVDLVAVGSHGLSGIRRFLLGSVSRRVLASAPCSVLIVRQQDAEGGAAATAYTDRGDEPWRLLLAYDGSTAANRVVDLCANLPLGSHGQIKVLGVMELIRMFRQDIRQQLSWLWQEKKATAAQALEVVKDRLQAGIPDVSTELLEHPDVSQAILEAGEELHSDLIMIGHKGKGALRKLLVGSVTSRVACHAHCSVLAVRDGS